MTRPVCCAIHTHAFDLANKSIVIFKHIDDSQKLCDITKALELILEFITFDINNNKRPKLGHRSILNNINEMLESVFTRHRFLIDKGEFDSKSTNIIVSTMIKIHAYINYYS